MNKLMIAAANDVVKHPALMALFFVGVFFFCTWSLSNFAFAEDLENVDTKIQKRFETFETKLKSLEKTVTRGQLEQQIHGLESEIFSLQRMADEGTAREVDYDRLSNLKSQLGTQTRELERLDQ